MRLLAALVLVLAVAASAAAQSKVESFTTSYDSDLGFYIHETIYEFSLPPYYDDSSVQSVNNTEVRVDLYWNTSRVWLIDGTIECWSENADRWLPYAMTISTHYITTMRTAVFSDSCRVWLAFVNDNDDRYVDSPQKAAVRINVSSTSGGWMRLTKSSPRQLAGEFAASGLQRVGRQVLLDRIAAATGR